MKTPVPWPPNTAVVMHARPPAEVVSVVAVIAGTDPDVYEGLARDDVERLLTHYQGLGRPATVQVWVNGEPERMERIGVHEA